MRKLSYHFIKYIIAFLLFMSCNDIRLSDKKDFIKDKRIREFDSLVFIDRVHALEWMSDFNLASHTDTALKLYLRNQYDLIYFENSTENIGNNLLRGIELSKQYKDDYLLNKNLILMGKFYTLRNNYTEALETFLEALDYFEGIHDAYHTGHIYNGLGILYFDMGNDELATSYFEKGLAEFIKINDQRGEAVIRSNIANLYINLNEHQTSLDHKFKALEKFIALKDTLSTAKGYLNIGYFYIETKNYILAQQYLQQADRFNADRESSGLEERIIFAHGKIHFYQKNYDSAKVFFLKSYEMADNRRLYNRKLESLDYLGQIAEVRQDIKTQNLYLKKHNILKDSIFSIESRNKIEDIRLGYNFNKQKLKEEMLVNNYHYEQNKTRLLTGLIILAALFAAYIFYSLQKNKNKNLLIKKIENLRLSEESKRITSELATERYNNELLSVLSKQQEMELELKNREITTINLQLMAKNNLMNEIAQVVDKKDAPENLNKNIKKILHKNTNNEKDWKLFQEIFEKIHPDFFNRLSEKYPNISKTETRVCAYIRIKMSNSEIANLMNISTQSLIKSRYRIRLKMNLHTSYDLDQHIAEI